MVACSTLGYNKGGSYQAVSSIQSSGYGWEDSQIPILMDEVKCYDKTNFFSCQNGDWGNKDCTHKEDVILTCNPNPKFSTWAEWSSCSKSCGYGTRVRTKKCVSNCDHVNDDELRNTQNCTIGTPENCESNNGIKLIVYCF